MLHGMGIQTGIDLDKLVDCGQLASAILDKKLPGRYLQAALAARRKNEEKVLTASEGKL